MTRNFLQHIAARLQALGSRSRTEAVLVLLAALLALSAGLSGCGDPGTGGSGLPGPTGSASQAGANNVPVAADFAVSGQIEVLAAGTVTISGQRYADTQLDIVLRDGSAGNFAALQVGQSVGLNPIANSSPPRWTLRILSP